MIGGKLCEAIGSCFKSHICDIKPHKVTLGIFQEV